MWIAGARGGGGGGGGGGAYSMENKDTNTDYYEVVSVEDQKREILEITIKIIFSFDLRFIFTISYIYREFSSAT